jgi:plasmid stability protein
LPSGTSSQRPGSVPRRRPARHALRSARAGRSIEAEAPAILAATRTGEDEGGPLRETRGSAAERQLAKGMPHDEMEHDPSRALLDGQDAMKQKSDQAPWARSLRTAPTGAA